MLFAGEEIRQVYLMTPKGIGLYLDVEAIRRTEEYVECAVRKYSGDDPDVTDGLLVFARVEKQIQSRRREIISVSPGLRWKQSRKRKKHQRMCPHPAGQSSRQNMTRAGAAAGFSLTEERESGE